MPDKKPDILEQFFNNWLAQRALRPPFDENIVTFDENVIGTTLYRDKHFQVQLFTVKPFTDIADHIHPNVDSFEFYIGGQIEFRHNGNKITNLDTVADNNGICNEFGKRIRVKPNDWHGGRFGEMGGAFLSVQHWINGVEPSSVHLDWAYQDQSKTARNEIDPGSDGDYGQVKFKVIK